LTAPPVSPLAGVPFFPHSFYWLARALLLFDGFTGTTLFPIFSLSLSKAPVLRLGPFLRNPKVGCENPLFFFSVLCPSPPRHVHLFPTHPIAPLLFLEQLPRGACVRPLRFDRSLGSLPLISPPPGCFAWFFCFQAGLAWAAVFCGLDFLLVEFTLFFNTLLFMPFLQGPLGSVPFNARRFSVFFLCSLAYSAVPCSCSPTTSGPFSPPPPRIFLGAFFSDGSVVAHSFLALFVSFRSGGFFCVLVCFLPPFFPFPLVHSQIISKSVSLFLFLF